MKITGAQPSVFHAIWGNHLPGFSRQTILTLTFTVAAGVVNIPQTGGGDER